MDDRRIEAMAGRLDRLERENRRRRRAAGVLIAATILLGLGRAPLPRRAAAGPAEQTADDRQVAKAAVEARLELARKAFGMIAASWRGGAPVSNQPRDVYAWSKRLLGAQIYLSMDDDELKVEDPEVYLAVAKARPKAERLAAFAAHLERMKQWEQRLRPLARDKIMAPFAYLDIQANRLQAEMWLARERLMQKQSGPAPGR
jgi:hypothetical protein